MNHPILCLGMPLPPEAMKLLEERGFVPSGPSLAAPGGEDKSATAPLNPLTPLQALIWSALTDRVMNHRQIALLEIHWRARRDGEGPLSVEEAGRRLIEDVGEGEAPAVDFVKGALRSFGRRLTSALEKAAKKTGPEAVRFDGVPFHLLFAIDSGPRGEVRYRLTDDGFRAVAAALGMPPGGHSAAGIQTGDQALDDPDQVVEFAMTKLSAALLMRVQRTMGTSLDETIRALAAQAGAQRTTLWRSGRDNHFCHRDAA